MASLRRFDVQARLALGLALAAVVPMVAALYFVKRNYNGDLGQIVYKNNTYAMGLLGAAALSMLFAAVACALGYVSAGQRINDRPGYSWTGFFVGGAVVTIDFIIVIAFWLLRLHHP